MVQTSVGGVEGEGVQTSLGRAVGGDVACSGEGGEEQAPAPPCCVAPLSSWSASSLVAVRWLSRFVVMLRVLVLGTWLSRPLPTHIMSSWARGYRVA